MAGRPPRTAARKPRGAKRPPQQSHTGPPQKTGRKTVARISAILFALVLLFNPYTQAWIAGSFVVDDGLGPADIIVALRGGQEEMGPRVDEAARLVTKHYAPLLLADVSSIPVYGAPEAQLFENYAKQKGVAPSQVRRCDNNADSTAEEAAAIRACLLHLGMKEVIVITSEYHTRRARSILQRAFSGLGIVVRVHPVYEPYYWNKHWWRNRRWAKTFFMEATKTVWGDMEQIAGAFHPHRNK